MTQPLITREAIRTTWNDCCFNKVEIEEVPEGGCTALQLLDSKMQYRDSLRVVLRPEFLPKSELRRQGSSGRSRGLSLSTSTSRRSVRPSIVPVGRTRRSLNRTWLMPNEI